MSFEHYFVLFMLFAIGCYCGGQFVTTFFWDNWAKIAADCRVLEIRNEIRHDPILDKEAKQLVLEIIDEVSPQ